MMLRRTPAARLRPPTLGLLLLTLLLPPALAGQESLAVPAEEASAEKASPGAFSYVGQAVVDALLAKYPGPSDVWTADVTAALPTPTTNGTATSWLVQTPPESHWGQPSAYLSLPDPGTPGGDQDPEFLRRLCTSSSSCLNSAICTPVDASVKKKGDKPKKMCLGHSDFFWNEMYKTIVQAKRYVDVTSLNPFQGQFDTALRNSIRYLASTKPSGPLVVRVYYGVPPIGHVADGIALPAKMSVYEEAEIPSAFLNHSKIIAVDETEAIVGGHEKLGALYLETNPVHDLSIHVKGPIVAFFHRYANRLWASAFLHPPAYQTPASLSAAGSVPIIAVSRLGGLNRSPSEDALYSMIDAAQRTIYLSQQDLVALLGDPEELLRHVAAALARQVDIYVVVSNKGAQSDWGYSDPEDDVDAIYRAMYSHPEFFPGATAADLRALLCRKLHLASIRYSSEDIWPGSTPIPNHAKFMMVDERAFYIGSHNAYASAPVVDYELAEAGVVVDHLASASYLLAHYWTPLWNNSKRVAVSGPEAAACAPAAPTPVTVRYFQGTFNSQPGYYGFLAAPNFILRPEPGVAPLGRYYDIEYGAGSTFALNRYCDVDADGTCAIEVTNNLPSGGGWRWRARRHDPDQLPGEWSGFSAFTPPLGAAAGFGGPTATTPPFSIRFLFTLNFQIPPAWETTYASYQPYLKWTDSGGRACVRRVIWRTADAYTAGRWTTANGQFHVYQLAPGTGAFSCGADFRPGAVVMEFGVGAAGCLDAGPCTPASGAPSFKVTLTNQP